MFQSYALFPHMTVEQNIAFGLKQDKLPKAEIASRVEEMLGATLSLHGWRLRGDPTLHPGGCKVSADEGDLDASVATRWQELCRLAAPGVV